ncbi:MerR family transcriptional regulator [Cytobacillus oceanisediminis]|uniref:MerR family transcriptional regulator n=2 Tax=Niallia TaxID=2837506 RepID=A0A941GER3_NIACI|nr:MULTISPECIES: MerR family transcriptional regulator [Bacillaceae]EOR23490.1 DNA binding protein [Niallia nealsonii AAU1]MBQ6449131.1 MerR family transcriptional regulator [Bacillus sp. (in: firmicutes)]MDU1847264.1 MerR family transcriptional regulator [Niallia nealsonii]MBZ9534207.1 MerR family transcriptional regulator [Cytobacillus oceanisediminis]MCB5238829.1 MerR family transcriptional regulator [Niallia circulans]
MLSVQTKELSIKEEKLLSVKEAAEYIEEGPGVVRNWLRELKTLIPVVIGENGYRYFDQKSLDILVKVKQMRNEKQMSLRQIEDELTSPVPASIPIATDATEKILQDLQTIKEELELQKNFNQVLVQQLKKQQEHIERQQEHIESQEKQIAFLENPVVLEGKEENLAKSRKTKQSIVSEKETKQKKSGFIRLFSYR